MTTGLNALIFCRVISINEQLNGTTYKKGLVSVFKVASSKANMIRFFCLGQKLDLTTVSNIHFESKVPFESTLIFLELFNGSEMSFFLYT